jgi:hypothetical protein
VVVRSAVVPVLGLAAWLFGASGGAAARSSPVLPAEIPIDQRLELQRLADSADVATRVEAEPFLTQRDVFEYLLDHPEFATHVTRALKLARYRIWSTPEGMFMNDGWGVQGHFRVVYATNGTRVFHAKGEYRKALLPTIQGEAVTVIEYAMTPAPDGQILVRSAVSGFVRLDNRLAALAVKVQSGIAQRKADREARRLMKIFTKVSRALKEDPKTVWTALDQRPDVPRRELEEFGKLLNVR